VSTHYLTTQPHQPCLLLHPKTNHPPALRNKERPHTGLNNVSHGLRMSTETHHHTWISQVRSLGVQTHQTGAHLVLTALPHVKALHHFPQPPPASPESPLCPNIPPMPPQNHTGSQLTSNLISLIKTTSEALGASSTC